VLGRDLHVEEAREVMAITRRIAALLLLAPALDASYASASRTVVDSTLSPSRSAFGEVDLLVLALLVPCAGGEGLRKPDELHHPVRW